jgi:endogenous inhibitor of DNA gyrase (YacG/DUF329 family)
MPETTTGRPAAGRKCPTCGAPAVIAYHPFCSRRCADADLNRWLTGRYAIPVRAEDDTDPVERPTEG